MTTRVPIQRKPRLGCLAQLILVLVLVVIVLVGLPAIFTPWAFYMGGRFHVLPYWQGWGRMHSNTAGGDYVIYISFSPKVGRTLGPRHVSGSGFLCTPRGERFYLKVGGDFQKDLQLDTNGKTASFYMDNNNTKSRFSGERRPYLELRGRWNNPDLALDDHGSIARNFDPDGSLATGHTHMRPYMQEVVPVTLHEGGHADFDAACAAVKTR